MCRQSIRLLWTTCTLSLGMAAPAAIASPLALSQSPPASVKEPPPNVILTIDDSRSLGNAGLQALKDALKDTFTEANVPDASIRLAWHSLNRCRVLPLANTTDAACGAYNGMRMLTAAHRKYFIDWVEKELYFEATGPSSTPSHLATQRVADYFKSRAHYNPWRNDPGDPANTAELSCRKSFHVFMTDGAWNYTGQTSVDGNGINMDANADGTSKRLPDGVDYDAADTNTNTRLYRDPWGSPKLSTFADLAFHLWSTDLRPDLTDNVRFRQNATRSESLGGQTLLPYWNPRNNPATWQHLVTYTIGFTEAATKWKGDPAWSGDMYSGAGIDSLMGGKTTWASPLCGPASNDPCAFDEAQDRRSQELWHAALNGRGRYVPTQTAADLSNAFRSILQTIQSESLGGAVSIAASARRLRKDGLIYLASFKTEPWSGDLTATRITAGNVDVDASPSWSAAALLDAATPASRLILTATGSRNEEFLWPYLTAVQKAALQGPSGTEAQGQARLDYLRGDRSQEASQSGGTLRTRSSLLGTFVNSNIWVTSSSPVYPVEYPGHAAFRQWVRTASKGSPRTPVVFVGSNDGMLHGFDGTTGAERLAYVPQGVYPQLLAYTDPSFTHRYMVDGSPFSGDVDVSQSALPPGGTPQWRTLLVSPLGAGGRGFAVLDITSTEPSDLRRGSTVVVDRSFDSAATTASFSGFEDVGHITASPTTDIANPIRADQFVRLNDGRWAVLLGNGVNSIQERPVLLIQYLDGARELTRLVASSKKNAGNGLGAPRPIDVDGNGTTDVVYAGDLQGQMWKFDLTSTDPQRWGVAVWNSSNVCNGATSTCEPLVTVRSAQNQVQSIQVAPLWVSHPMGGLVLNFGTGRLLEDKDRKDTTPQTLYGIWDSSSYRRTTQGVTATHGPNVTSVKARSSLVQQTFTGSVTRTAASFDPRSFTTSSRNPVGYSTTVASAPRGWFIDLPAPGERLLAHPQLQDGRMVRFETQIPPQTPEEGLCSTSIRSEEGYTLVLNGVTGHPGQQPVFATPDSTINLVDASRVKFGNGDSIQIETGDAIYLKSSSVDGQTDMVGDINSQFYRYNLQLLRQKASRRTVDWRVLP